MPIRMRFPAQALDELRREDPATPVTLNYIRALASSGKIPVVMVGRRRLINYDALVDYLAHPERAARDPLTLGGIRRVD